MRIIRLGTHSGRAKDVTDALRGSVVLLAVLGVFVGTLAVPVYFLALFMAGLGLANWLNALCCAVLAAAELYLLVLIPEFPRYRPPAKGALIRPQDPAKATVPRPIAARALLNEREVAGFAGACICVGDLRRRS